MLLVRGLGTVLGDLAALGYDCRWTCLSAADCGAPHKRDRIWILAHANSAAAWSAGGTACSDRGWSCRRDESAFRQAHREDGADRLAPSGPASHTEGIGRGQGRTRRTPAPDQDGFASWHSDAQSERCTETREHRCDEPAQRSGGICADADASIIGLERQQQTWPEDRATDGPDNGSDSGRWPAEPDVCRVAHGVADWKHRIIAIGNGQVPRVRAAAWRILTAGFLWHDHRHPHRTPDRARAPQGA